MRVEDDYLGISIHAPVKGATVRALLVESHILNFNPRSREGSDSTRFLVAVAGLHFNPRSREGSDPRERTAPCGARISIHASVKGATARC